MHYSPIIIRQLTAHCQQCIKSRALSPKDPPPPSFCCPLVSVSRSVDCGRRSARARLLGNLVHCTLTLLGSFPLNLKPHARAPRRGFFGEATAGAASCWARRCHSSGPVIVSAVDRRGRRKPIASRSCRSTLEGIRAFGLWQCDNSFTAKYARLLGRDSLPQDVGACFAHITGKVSLQPHESMAQLYHFSASPTNDINAEQSEWAGSKPRHPKILRRLLPEAFKH